MHSIHNQDKYHNSTQNSRLQQTSSGVLRTSRTVCTPESPALSNVLGAAWNSASAAGIWQERRVCIQQMREVTCTNTGKRRIFFLLMFCFCLFFSLPLIESQQFVRRWIHTVHVPMRCQSSGPGDNNKPRRLFFSFLLSPLSVRCSS